MLNWAEIFDEAFKLSFQDGPKAVPGAKFRQLVARIVEAQGEAFPPPNMGKFSKFLTNFPDQLLIQSSLGQDVLIVPADRPELLVEGRGLNARIRPDLFTALTKIENNLKYYYLPERDSVEPVRAGDQPAAGALELPATSLEGEIALRRKFVASGDFSVDAKTDLDSGLAAARPLTSFTEAIKSFGLSRDWHRFRVAAVVGLLRKWSLSNGLAWNPSWLTDGEPTSANAPIPAARLEQDLSSLIQALAGQVSEADLSRISVPLDIVMKLVSQKR